MRKAVAYLRTHPLIALLAVAGIAAILVLVVLPQRSRPLDTSATAPMAPVAATPPAPAPAPAPAGPAAPGAAVSPGAPTTAAPPAPAASPKPVASPRPGVPVDAGRTDPFGPLVRQQQPGGGGGLPPLPPAPLPPPLFPGQQPGQPGGPPVPAPKEASGAALVGILGDGGAVAIIKIGKDTFIVVPGDVIAGKIRVEVVDVSKRLVILEQEGERFELKMGGVNGPHVAAAASSHFN
ncbi:MAG: hypothetical protein ACT4PY_04205 [Armatimonadota bacterium]